MENRWTLHVKDFGCIKEADVTVSPLTLFVGDNNSGKSYLMTLIYTLLNFSPRRYHYDLCKDSTDYRICVDWLRAGMEQAKNAEGEDAVLLLTKDVFQALTNLLNAVLKKNWNAISRRVFHKIIEIGEISVSWPDCQEKKFAMGYDIEIEDEEEDEDGGVDEDEVEEYTLIALSERINQPFSNAAGINVMSWEKDVDVDFFICYLLEYLLKWDFTVFHLADGIAFLPTSRTGFILTYPALVGDAIDEKFQAADDSESSYILTRPSVDFLKSLSYFSNRKPVAKYEKITQFLERNMIKGRIERHSGPLSSYSYRPEKAENEDIPLYLSSGVVTELTPLLLTLKYSRRLFTLFMEEPEMALHPALQKKIAQVFIRLSNMGTPVFLTTHSDTIINHINDMIMLQNQPNAKRKKLLKQFSYETSDLITAENVSMYEFQIQEDGMTVLHRCQAGAYGFEVPHFIDALETMLEESRAFEGEDED